MTPAFFTQLRKLYSSSSLTTELLLLQEGQYVVRATVTVESQIMATAMAAHSQIEIAEDKAIERLGKLLGIPMLSIVEPLMSIKPALEPGPDVASEPALPSSTHPSRYVEQSQAPESQRPTNQEPPPLVAVKTPQEGGPKSTKLTIKPLASPPEVKMSDAPQPIKPKAVVPKAVAEVEPEVEINLNPIPPLNLVAPEEEERPLDEIPDEIPQFSNPEPTEVVEKSMPAGMPASSIAANAMENFDSSTNPVDLSDIIAQTDVELSRLGWTSKQGREHLEKNYQKRSRQQLNDEELLEFLLYLESQPTPVI